MKRHHLITLFLTIFFVGVSMQLVNAQSVDQVCGSASGSSPKCSLSHIKTVIGNFLGFLLKIGSVLLTTFVLYRFAIAWFALQQGKTDAYRTATKQAVNALFGFLIITAILGGLFAAMLKFISAQDWTTSLIKAFSEAFVPHAYAAESEYLPNPLGTESVYDFILAIVRMVIRWFIYPALIVMWVWSGFSYVIAQGNPEKISKTHKWLLAAFASTLIVFMTEGFLFAIRGTVDSIFPKTTQSTQTTQTTQTSDYGLNNTNQTTGQLCYSNSNCATGYFCKFNARGDKGTCQKSGVACNMISSQSSCQSAISNNTGENCKWSGGRDAICTD